jgi:hypothetical protein
MIVVTEDQLRRIAEIRDAFPDTPLVPPDGAWREASADTVWIRLVSQVVVVGRAAPAKRLWEPSIRQRIAWERVSTIADADAREAIWGVLREIKARYAGRDAGSCRKTAGIMKNRAYLMQFPGGPKVFLETAATMPGDDQARIDFVIKHLSFIKNKGARDFPDFRIRHSEKQHRDGFARPKRLAAHRHRDSQGRADAA